MTMSIAHPHRIIFLWLIITIGMLFHQFFSLHNLRFGMDVIKSGYDAVPNVEQIKRLTLYVLPLMYVAINALWQNKAVALLNVIAAPFYLAFHAWHFAHEWGDMSDPVQWVLLTFLVAWSLMLLVSAVGYLRSFSGSENARA